jgi:pyruvate kinase
MRRHRNAKIVATLGPASSTRETIRALFEAGADVFRLNFSHGSHEEHKQRYDLIRQLEQETGRPIGILVDLQGPKLRVGTFEGGRVALSRGERFDLDLDGGPGTHRRVSMPHPEVFQALAPGVELLLDDGKIRLAVESCEAGRRRDAVRPQGGQRRWRRAAAVGADRKGPARPRFRA